MFYYLYIEVQADRFSKITSSVKVYSMAMKTFFLTSVDDPYKEIILQNFLEISNGIKISLSLALINHGRQKGITIILVRHLYQSPLENALSFGIKLKNMYIILQDYFR